MRLLVGLRGLRPMAVVLVSLAMVAAVAMVDRVTGPDLSVTAGYMLAVLLVTAVLRQPVPDLVALLCAVVGTTLSLGQDGAGGLGTEIASGISRLIVLVVASHLGGLLLVLVDSLERAATTDPMTGLLNRRGLNAMLDVAIAQADRAGTQVTLVAFDLDGLKRVNDEEGHHAGDALLRRFADVLHREARAADHVARVGGDEFVVVLPNVGEDGADALRDRLVANPETPPFGFGIATRDPAGPDAATLFQEADLALVTAKQRRRDGTDR